MEIRRLRIISIIWICIQLAACAAPYRTPTFNPEVSDFPGIYDALAISGTKSVDVILVHGMCTHKVDWVTQTNNELADSLNMKLEKVDTDSPIVLADTLYPDHSDHAARLYVGRISGFGFTVNTFSIVWSPISDDAKGALCYDVSAGNATCASAGTITTGKRVVANRFLKETLLDNCLADAVFYAGEVGKSKIQSALRRGVSYVLFGNQSSLCGENAAIEMAPGNKSETPLILVTESLGSKMLYDTLMNTATSCRNENLRGFSDALHRPMEVFMAANQMPILSLADPTSGASANAGAAPNDADHVHGPIDVTPAVNPVIDIFKLSTQGGVPSSKLRRPKGDLNNEVGVLAPKWVVAFSDPNDLFSYTLRSSDCKDGQTCGTVDNIHFSDVLVSNDWSYLFSLENPYSAHTEYLARKASGIGQVVAKMIACGGRNFKQSCDPSTDGAGTAARP